MGWKNLAIVAIAAFALSLPGCEYGGPIGGSNVNIWKAVEREDLDAIKAYAARGGNLDTGKTLYKKTPLIHALELKKRRSYETLLSLGANPNTECRGGKVATHLAALERDAFWLEAALSHGGDPNLMMKQAKGIVKGRPLRWAIGGLKSNRGKVENVRLLLDHGADIDARIDEEEHSALARACQTREFEIVHLLLERGADYNETNRKGETFIFAIRSRRPGDLPDNEYNKHDNKWSKAVWDWLLAHGVDPDKAKWGGDKWILE